MKFLLLVFLATLSFASSLSLIQEKLSKGQKIKIGKRIYEETCISCHGIDGNTNPSMQLVVKPRVLSKSILTETQAYKIIKYGAHAYGSHADIMPIFKDVYSDTQLKAVAHYISKTFNAKRDEKVKKLLDESRQLSQKDKEKMIQVGKKIFQRKCAMCHGVTGNGESEYVKQSKMNKNFIYPYNLQKILLNEQQIFLYAKFGGKFWGTVKNDMPSWKKKYNDIKLKSVAHYIATRIKKMNEQKN